HFPFGQIGFKVLPCFRIARILALECVIEQTVAKLLLADEGRDMKWSAPFGMAAVTHPDAVVPCVFHCDCGDRDAIAFAAGIMQHSQGRRGPRTRSHNFLPSSCRLKVFRLEKEGDRARNRGDVREKENCETNLFHGFKLTGLWSIPNWCNIGKRCPG